MKFVFCIITAFALFNHCQAHNYCPGLLITPKPPGVGPCEGHLKASPGVKKNDRALLQRDIQYTVRECVEGCQVNDNCKSIAYKPDPADAVNGEKTGICKMYKAAARDLTLEKSTDGTHSSDIDCYIPMDLWIQASAPGQVYDNYYIRPDLKEYHHNNARLYPNMSQPAVMMLHCGGRIIAPYDGEAAQGGFVSQDGSGHSYAFVGYPDADRSGAPFVPIICSLNSTLNVACTSSLGDKFFVCTQNRSQHDVVIGSRNPVPGEGGCVPVTFYGTDAGDIF